MKRKKIHFQAGIILLPFVLLFTLLIAASEPANNTADRETVKKIIHDSIGWALKKDQARLFDIFTNTPDLLIINPYSKPLTGFEALKKQSQDVWMTPHFKAISFDVRDLKIRFSRSGDVAWYSAVLDDIAEWKGKRGGWYNTRWTGVLEKRDGKWVIVQQHFSFDANDILRKSKSNSTKN